MFESNQLNSLRKQPTFREVATEGSSGELAKRRLISQAINSKVLISKYKETSFSKNCDAESVGSYTLHFDPMLTDALRYSSRVASKALFRKLLLRNRQRNVNDRLVCQSMPLNKKAFKPKVDRR